MYPNTRPQVGVGKSIMLFTSAMATRRNYRMTRIHSSSCQVDWSTQLHIIIFHVLQIDKRGKRKVEGLKHILFIALNGLSSIHLITRSSSSK